MNASPRQFRLPPSDKEIAAILAAGESSAGSDNLREIATIINGTGIRPGELCRLLWTDVQLDKGCITLRMNKSGQTRWVPVNDQIRQVLCDRKARQKRCRYVLGKFPRQAMDRASRLLAAVSGQVCGRHICLYDLRVAFGVRWLRSGGDALTLARLLGSSLSTIARILGSWQRFLSKEQELLSSSAR